MDRFRLICFDFMMKLKGQPHQNYISIRGVINNNGSILSSGCKDYSTDEYNHDKDSYYYRGIKSRSVIVEDHGISRLSFTLLR